MHMSGFPILSALTWLPLLGGGAIMLLRGDEEQVARRSRWIALATTLLVFLLSLLLWTNFDRTRSDFQFIENLKWLPEFGVGYKLGVDGISVLLVLLTTLLMPLCVLSSWRCISRSVREYMLTFLLFETMTIGMFCALDLLIFYIFFEGVLVPMFLIIGIWGGTRRVYSAFKFFLFTFAGSVLMLLALLAMWRQAGTTDIVVLLKTPFPPHMQIWLFLAFFASFAVKLPMWPFHTWLPDAHVEAPTAGSVILAGVMLKMGGYGFIRFSIPMLPFAAAAFAPLMLALSVAAVIYTSIVALAQDDMKKVIAYSSVAHMGIVTIGLFSFNIEGVDGAMFQMLAHGVVSSALFLGVGVVYDRLHSHEIDRFGGLARRMPRYALVFMFFTMAANGLPGTAGFVGEFLVTVGALKVSPWLALFGGTGMILGAVYMLHLYRAVLFGPLAKAELLTLPDLSLREIALFAPLAMLTLWMGIYPSSFLKVFEASVSALVAHHAVAAGVGGGPLQ